MRRECNPADLLTRVIRPEELHSNSTWQRGPEFLSRPIQEWPLRKDPVDELPDRIETVIAHVQSTADDMNIIDVNRFSSYGKMMKVTSRILNAKKNKSLSAISVSPTVDDLVAAESWWVKRVQTTLHPDWENCYRRLGPALRKDGIIIVGERIPKWLKDNYNQNEYILLPSDHPFTRLYVKSTHEIDHSGIESTLAKIQTKFWIPTVRKLIRSVKEKCTHCRRLKKVIEGQAMGQLPPERLKPSPPFMNTSLDLFGPFIVKDTVKRRTKRKAYGVIFNCLSTRAVYIDLVEGYGTKDFLDAFRRFCSIHGYPSKVFSDHGTQLVSANKELRSIMANWSDREIKDFCVGGNCTFLWVHNKSADAPWQNGCSEALIKSVKRCLVIAINESVLSFSELQTVLFEIANLLNERPIGIKPGCDPELGSYLCPNDLLLGRTFNKAISGPFLQANYGRRLAFNQKIVVFLEKVDQGLLPNTFDSPKMACRTQEPEGWRYCIFPGQCIGGPLEVGGSNRC